MKKGIYLLLFLNIFAGLNAQSENQDSLNTSISTWKLGNHFSNIIPLEVDTSLKSFQIYNKLYDEYIFPSYLGNLGSPGISNNYFQRKQSKFFFLQHFMPYLNMPGNQVYINTKKPFSEFVYSTGGGRQQQEQVLKFLHTQNINPLFNAGLKLDLYSSDGQYSYQKGSDISFLFFTSYQGNQYSIFGHAGMNTIKMDENGGIQNDSDLEGQLAQDVPTNLDAFNTASTLMKNKNVFFTQYFTIGKFQSGKDRDSSGIAVVGDQEGKHWAKLVHVFQYSTNHKIYSDLDPNSGFYRNIYIDSTNTSDSVYFRTLYNSLALNLQSNPDGKFHLGFSVGIENEINRYSYDITPVYTVNYEPAGEYVFPDFTALLYLNDSTAKRRTHEDISNTALFGRIVNDLGENLGWEANGKLYFQGYKAGSLNIDVQLFKSFNTKKGTSQIVLHGQFRNERPIYWLNHFSSNNFSWENDLNFENDIRVGGLYKHPARMFMISADLAILSNKVYIDSLALPAQESTSFMVFSALVQKDFSLWKFKFDNKLNVQYTGDSYVLPLPLLSFRNSTYLEHNFIFDWTKGELLTQLGFDLYYHTAFYTHAYMPSTGRFYSQTEKEVGNYPFIDVFLNFNVKRTRIFLKYEHVTSGMIGYNFFTVLHYPMNQGVFKFGFSWLFHD